MLLKNKTESTLPLLELVQCSLTTPLHTVLHYTTLHHTTLHYTLQFSTVGTSELRTLSRTQEKHSFGNLCHAQNGRRNILIWPSFEPDRRPCRPLLQSVTRVAQTLTRYVSGDRRIWVKFLAGRKDFFIHPRPHRHTSCGSPTLICTKANGECR